MLGRGKKSVTMKKYKMITVLTIVLTLLAATSTSFAYPPETNDWPKFHGNPRNTGQGCLWIFGIKTPRLLWDYATDNTKSPSSPSLADIDGDGELEVVVGTANDEGTGGICVLEADGLLKWEYATGDDGTYSSPCVDDLDGDGYLDIAFVSWHGDITVLEHDGTTKWSLAEGGDGTYAVIADIDRDGGKEVVAGAAGRTWALDDDGTVIWSRDFAVMTEPAIEDVDGDGGSEIVFGFSTIGLEYGVVALNSDGSTEWSYFIEGQILSLSITGDLDGDGNPDVVAGCEDGNVYAFSGADGSEIWSYSTVGEVLGIAVADMNVDGVDDAVVSATDGVASCLYVLSGVDGSEIWTYNVLGLFGIPSVADVNVDGLLDVIVGSMDGSLYAISGDDGSEIWIFDLDDPSLSAPAIADINGDRIMEIIISAGDTVYAITGPRPVVETTDIAGNVRNEFLIFETVYIVGNGYFPETSYDLYITEDTNWYDGRTISGLGKGFETNEEGNIAVGTAPEPWEPLPPGRYDIIVDVNRNGVYDEAIDAIDDMDVGTAGFFVVPEIPFGSITAVFLAFVALFIIHRRPVIKIRT